jgi:hypothetical protein
MSTEAGPPTGNPGQPGDPLGGARWYGLGTGPPQAYYPTLLGAMQAPNLGPQGLAPPFSGSQPMATPGAATPALPQYLHNLGPPGAMPPSLLGSTPTLQGPQLPVPQARHALSSFAALGAAADASAAQHVGSGRGGGSEQAHAAGLGFSPTQVRMGHGQGGMPSETANAPGAGLQDVPARLPAVKVGQAPATADAAAPQLPQAPPYPGLMASVPPAMLSLPPLQFGQGMPSGFPSVAALLGGYYWQGAPVPSPQLMARNVPVGTAGAGPIPPAPGAAAIPLFAVQPSWLGVPLVPTLQ